MPRAFGWHYNNMYWHYDIIKRNNGYRGGLPNPRIVQHNYCGPRRCNKYPLQNELVCQNIDLHLHFISLCGVNVMMVIIFPISIYIHCLPIVWNHHNSTSRLPCLYGAKFFEQHLTSLTFKHIENMFIHNMFSVVCLKFELVRCSLKKNGTV